ncbi:hypothetical protein B0H12DRAFT_1242339 [Mycena haematopus]|nr:hypothetical protein B0H12DRAFT_1242339 [Mycena haematopus]
MSDLKVWVGFSSWKDENFSISVGPQSAPNSGIRINVSVRARPNIYTPTRPWLDRRSPYSNGSHTFRTVSYAADDHEPSPGFPFRAVRNSYLAQSFPSPSLRASRGALPDDLVIGRLSPEACSYTRSLPPSHPSLISQAPAPRPPPLVRRRPLLHREL